MSSPRMSVLCVSVLWILVQFSAGNATPVVDRVMESSPAEGPAGTSAKGFQGMQRQKRSIGPNCTSPLDLIFVLESSYSVSMEEWKMLKNFVCNLIDELTIGPNDTHVGVVTFGSSGNMVIPIGRFLEKEALKKRIQIEGKRSGTASIFSGLELAKQMLNGEEIRYIIDPLPHQLEQLNKYKGRPNVPNKVILVMDGTEDTVHNEAERARIIQQLQATAEVIGVIVYPPIFPEQLIRIAGNEDNTRRVDWFYELDDIFQWVVDKMCA